MELLTMESLQRMLSRTSVNVSWRLSSEASASSLLKLLNVSFSGRRDSGDSKKTVYIKCTANIGVKDGTSNRYV